MAIYSLDNEISGLDISSLNTEFGDFFGLYCTQIMQMPEPENPMLPGFMMRFTNDPVWADLGSLISEAYPDLNVQEKELGSWLASYAAHFNLDTLPQLVAYNSGFNVGIFPSDRWLGVGLEWYLSSDNRVVRKLPPDLFPQYKRDKMRPEYLSINAFKGWLFYRHQELSGEDLINQIVFRGKVLFLTKVLSNVSDELLLNYSSDQLEWCRDNEFGIWTHLLENDMVFTKDFREINKLVSDGPFTPGMPPESPGGVGNWLGLQMVESFMDKNGKVSLKELMSTNAQVILQSYKPN